MPRIEPELQRLQEIKTLPSLLKYLKEDLNWPIGSDDVEEVTFDYDPAELGFDSASTAKIDEVRQLRPLTAGQKWGIFWVKFGKKQLPVQMLRRALGNLVVKKRATTKKSDKAAWHMHDLLFISAYGDDSNRHITFAHFSESEDSERSLPVLKVLGWDDDDTLLHLKDTYKTLLTSLNWETTPTGDPEAWREHWSKAFKLTHKEVIDTTKELVVELAHLATVIKKSVLTSINAETVKGPWKKLMLAFQKTLIKDLNEEQFADVIAQTVSYGLLTARLSSDGPISLKNLVDMVPSTNPFLKELLQHFLTSAGMKGLFDVDEAGINDVVELLNRSNAQAIRNDFGKKTDGEDPVIHFYEHFLGAYNKKLKVERGVFYTPQPIVSYIVSSVHELLQKEYGLEDGLADTSTWAEVKNKHKSLKIPGGIKDPTIEPFVQILDPATGTATFLIEVIEVIHNTMVAKWDKDRVSKADQTKKWNAYVPTHLLPRLYAYELMMAPYAIAHMKMGLKLTETGFTAWEKLGPENRANIYLTNALEPWAAQLDLPGFDALAHEAAAVNEVKKNKKFTVITGNPPYSGVSSNNSEYAVRLVDAYKVVDGEALGEKKLWLQDDYVKFIRHSQMKLESSGAGVLGFITNHGYLDNPTFRGMRESLMKSQHILHILDLHGNANKGERAPDGGEDQNVFEIKQGVSIIIGASSNQGTQPIVEHFSLWGPRTEKYKWLAENSLQTTRWGRLAPCSPYRFFTPYNQDTLEEYQAFFPLEKVVLDRTVGMITARDALTIHFTREEIIKTIQEFSSLTEKEARERFELGKDARDWSVERAQEDLLNHKLSEKCLRKVLYRPFDVRHTFYTGTSRGFIGQPQKRIMSHLDGEKNMALCISRFNRQKSLGYFFATRTLTDFHLLDTVADSMTVFPLYLSENNHAQGELSLVRGDQPNLAPEFLTVLSRCLNDTKMGPLGLPAGIDPEDIFQYIYAVFHSNGYRKRYSEFLKIDFPRLPLTGNNKLFHSLSKLGGQLISLHLLESTKLNDVSTEFLGKSNIEVEKPSWSKNTVWTDKAQTVGFNGINEEVWNFHVGGYQVCEKWLKDRKGRKLTKEDIAHYQKIVVALSETIRLIAEIDKVIDEHGGWPGAFQSGK
jgi:predicted helicase